MKRLPKTATQHHLDAEVAFTGVPDGVFVVDESPSVVAVNPAFAGIVGMDTETILGLTPPFPWWPPEVARELDAYLGMLLSGLDPPVYDGDVLHVPSGRRVPVQATLSAATGPGGDRLAFFSLRPAGESPEKGHAPTTTERRLTDAIAKLPVGVLLYDLQELRVIAANPAACEILGADERAVLASRDAGFGLECVDEHGEPLAEDRRPARRFLDTGFPQRVILGFDRLSDGRRRWVIETFTALEPADTGSAPEAALVTLEDITDLRLAEEGVRAGERRLQALFDHNPDAILRLTTQGRVLAASPAAERVLGAPAAVLRGVDPAEWMHPDDAASWRQALLRMTAGEFGAPVTVRLRAAGGGWIWAEVTGAPVYDAESARIVEVQQSLRDVSDRVRRERTEVAQARIAAAVAAGATASSTFGLIAEQVADAEDLDLVAVIRFEGTTGIVEGYWRAGSPPDTAPKDVVMDLDRGDTATARVLATGRPAVMDIAPAAGGVSGQGGYPQLAKGLACPIVIDGEPWGALAAGTLAGGFSSGAMERVERFAGLAALAVAATRDRERLSETITLYATLAETLPNNAVTVVGRDLRYRLLQGPIVGRLTDAEDVLGTTPEESLSPEWADSTMAAHRRALRGETVTERNALRGGRYYDIWVAPLRTDEDITGATSLIVDVTDRALMEIQEERLGRIARAVAEGAPEDRVLAIVVESVVESFEAVGAAVVRFGADGAGDVVASFPEGRPLESPGPDPDSTVEAVRRLGRAVVTSAEDAGASRGSESGGGGGTSGAAAPITVRGHLWGALTFGRSDGAGLPPQTADRLARFADLVGTSITNLEAWQALEHEALTDPLTQLGNRRAFDLRLDEEVRRARRFARPLSLVMLDVDRFTAVNDSFGHDVGDAVLRHVARVAQRTTRAEALVCRFGGEEFALLLPEAGGAEAVTAAERLRHAVETSVAPGLPPVTVSCGVAELVAGMDGAGLVQAADMALHTAKAAGRNATWQAGSGGRQPEPGAPA